MILFLPWEVTQSMEFFVVQHAGNKGRPNLRNRGFHHRLLDDRSYALGAGVQQGCFHIRKMVHCSELSALGGYLFHP